MDLYVIVSTVMPESKSETSLEDLVSVEDVTSGLG